MWPFKPDVGKLKARGDVAALGKASRYRDAEVRAEALQALGELGGKAAVEPIVAALADRDAGVRKAALGVLEAALENEKPDVSAGTIPPCLDRLKDPRALEPLGGLLAFAVGRHPLVAQAAARALKRLAASLDESTRAFCAIAEQDWEAAAQLGAQAVGPLLAVLRNPNADRSDLAPAADALGRIGDPEAAAPLTHLLQHDDPEVAAAAARNLQKLGAPISRAAQAWCCIALGDWQGVVALGGSAIHPLCARVEKAGWNRLAMVDAIGRIGGTEAAARLAELLAKGAPELAAAAAEALGGLDRAGADAVAFMISTTLKDSPDGEVSARLVSMRTPPELLGGLLEKAARIRRIAVEALRLSGQPAVPALCQALEAWAEHVRQAAAEALGELGDRRAVGPLARRLEEDRDLGVCRTAFDALQRLGWTPSLASEAAVRNLCGRLRSGHSGTRQAAAVLLGELGDRRAIEALAALLGEDDSEAAGAALEALGKLRWDPASLPEAAVETLGGRLGDSSGAARNAIAALLGETGNTRAIPFLTPMLADKDLAASRAAAEALEKLGWTPATPEEQAQAAIVQGRWEDAVSHGRRAVAALDTLDLGNGGDKEWGLIAGASGWLYSQGEAERTLKVLLDGIGEPGNRRYACSRALAKLYRSGQLSEEHKQRILAQRRSIVASRHIDASESPHCDQTFSSDCGHTDSMTHRDTRADVELL